MGWKKAFGWLRHVKRAMPVLQVAAVFTPTPLDDAGLAMAKRYLFDPLDMTPEERADMVRQIIVESIKKQNPALSGEALEAAIAATIAALQTEKNREASDVS